MGQELKLSETLSGLSCLGKLFRLPKLQNLGPVSEQYLPDEHHFDDSDGYFNGDENDCKDEDDGDTDDYDDECGVDYKILTSTIDKNNDDYDDYHLNYLNCNRSC